MAFYRTREGQVTASDSFTNIGGLYGQSTTASVQVPAGSSSIVGLIASVATDGASNASTTFACQISGDGLSSGQETMVFAGCGVDGTPVSNGQTVSAFKLDVSIPVIASNQVSIAVAMSGDTGTCETAITLVFQ
jgi:hypothetical protein